jgi:hypothetical protein
MSLSLSLQLGAFNNAQSAGATPAATYQLLMAGNPVRMSGNAVTMRGNG